jgi:hypothetical protein
VLPRVLEGTSDAVGTSARSGKAIDLSACVCGQNQKGSEENVYIEGKN